MPATTGDAASGSSALCITCMTTCGSSCVAAVAMLLITSGSRSGDITETMLVRWRKAASTVAACDVIIGEPSSVHFGAATAVARSPMSRGAAGDREQALLRALVEDRLSVRRRSTATIERQRSSRLAGSATSPSSRASTFS